MKQLQKIRLTVSKGKIQDKIKLGDPRPVNDNVADNLLTQAEQFNPKQFGGIKHIELWEEVGTSKATKDIKVEAEEVSETPKKKSK